jgi:hypothetical protein
VLRLLYPDDLIQREIEEAERIGSEEAAAFRVLVGTPEGDAGATLGHLAAELTAGEEPREVALVQFGQAPEALEIGGGIESLAASLDSLHDLETSLESTGVPVYARSRTTDDPGRLLGLLADQSVADLVLVPADPAYAPPTGTQAPLAPTLRLVPAEQAGTDGAVLVHLGGDGDRTTLEIGVRLAMARGSALRIEGQPGRRVASTVADVRDSGLVADGDGPVAIEVRSGAPGRTASPVSTLWVQMGRDDGAARLSGLIDRLRSSRAGGS